jgi:DNA-binding CsgD family transcriptional regulator
MEGINMANVFDNHSMIRYADDVASICQPLKQYFSINDFHYEKIYKDNSKTKLVSRADWVSFYYKNGFQYFGEYETSIADIHGGFYLTAAMARQNIFMVARENFNIDNGILIVDKYEDYCELFWFGSVKGDLSALHFYLNNMDLIRRFILYFKERAASIIEKADRERILIPSKKIITDDSQIIMNKGRCGRHDFINSIRVERYHLSGSYSYVMLTEREFECAVCLLEGKTAQQIGNNLHLSRRTVETHLANIKSKVSCKTKGDLIEILLKSGFGVYTNKDIMFY